MNLTIKTKMPEVILRPWQDGDQLTLSSIANDLEIWRNLRDHFPHPYRLEDAEAWVATASKQRPLYNLAIVLNGKVAGGIGMEPGRDIMRFVGEVGFWIGTKHQGTGILKAAIPAYAKYAFDNLGFRFLTSMVLGWNEKGAHTLEACGFQRMTTYPKAGNKDREFVDVHLYGISPKPQL
ncbi:MAG: GNAT family N-acetyltransferase [Bacteroidetes bacterium]|jgi:ribosomal-protein-alanine N-acetyltransferase|nr:GNAT family N-acetyltransferase [Bacteroidota bacterium]